MTNEKPKTNEGGLKKFEDWKSDLEERASKEASSRQHRLLTAGDNEPILISDEEVNEIINKVAGSERLNSEEREKILQKKNKIRLDMEKNGWRLIEVISGAAVIGEIKTDSKYNYEFVNVDRVCLVFMRPKSYKASPKPEGAQSEIKEYEGKAMPQLIMQMKKDGYECIGYHDDMPFNIRPDVKVIRNTTNGKYYLFVKKR